VKLSAVLASLIVAAGLTLSGGCGNGVVPQDNTAGAGLSRLVSAKAMSSHYVEVTFAAPVGTAGDDPANYTIQAIEDGEALAVTAARRVGDGSQVILTTGKQKVVTYGLSAGKSSSTGAKFSTVNYQTGTTFNGVEIPEPYMEAAISISNTQVLITFSEPLEGPPAENVLNWRIANPDLNIISAQIDGIRRRVTLTTEPQRNILYTVKAVNLTRPSAVGGDFIDPERNSTSFWGTPATDNVGPRVMKAVSLGSTAVALYFSEPIEQLWAAPQHYAINNSLHVLNVVFDEYGAVAFLTTTPQTPGTIYTVEVSSVRDLARNLIDADNDTATFEMFPNDTSNPQVISAVSTSLNTVLVSFSEPMAEDAGDATKYTIAPTLPVIGAQLNAYRTQVLLETLPQTPGVNYLMTAASVLKDVAGNALAVGSNTAAFEVDPLDNTPPVIIKFALATTTTAIVYFSEPMADSALDPTNYEFSPEVVVTDAAFNSTRTVVTLTTLPMIAEQGYDLDVLNVTDLAGNPLASTRGGTTVIFSGATAGSELARVVGAASLHNKAVIVQFSKPMGDSAINPAHYYIVQANVNAEVGFLTVMSADWADAEHTSVGLVTLSQNEVTYDLKVVNIKDASGNPMAPRSIPGLLDDPEGASFPGNPPGLTDITDTDGDGLNDNVEQRGYEIEVQLQNGTIVTREVTSSPFTADTDGDELDDKDERRLLSDPRAVDTDFDGLADADEYNIYFTDHTDQDSDDDGINDQDELAFFKTSPILADTDGDGFEDGRELFELNRNPRVADLPVPQIIVGDMRLQIDERYTFQDETGTTITQTDSTQVSMTQSSESKLSTVDTSAWKINAEIGGSIGAKYGADAGVEIKGEAKVSGGYESTTETTNESTRGIQNAYERSFQKGREFSQNRSVTRTVEGAAISTNISIKNAGEIAFSITNMEVSVLQQGPSRDRFVPVATLIPESTLLTGNVPVFNLGPLDPERGPIIFSSREVFPNLVEELMRQPRGLIFRLANFDVLDEFGRNRAFSSQEVVDRTAGITVDYGDGEVERYLVAVNAQFDASLFLGGYCDGDTCKSIVEPEDGDGQATTVAEGDDVQVIASGSPAAAGAVIITAGTNGVIDTPLDGDDVCSGAGDECEDDDGCPGGACAAPLLGGFDDLGRQSGLPIDYILQDLLGLTKNPAQFDAIVAGYDRVATTIAAGDDVQVVPPGTTGLDDRQIIVLAGQNGVLDTTPNNGNQLNATLDDTFAKTVGYETSLTCNEFTAARIAEPEGGVCTAGTNQGKFCDTDANCPGSVCQCTADFCDGIASTVKVGDDVQVIAVGQPVRPGQTIVSAGPNGVIDTVQGGDEIFRGPGDVCFSDAGCPQNPAAGSGNISACNGREVLTRFKNSKTGDPNRFWITITQDGIPAGTSFGDYVLKPGKAITLAFGQDVDRDGMFLVEEYIHGSSDRLKDTDTDGLGDFTEVRLGWKVQLAGETVALQVYPDPRLDDSDRDDLRDDIESRCKTNPRLRDTDNDGLTDDFEMGYDGATGEVDPEIGACCTDATAASCGPVSRFCGSNADCAVVGVCCTSAAGTSCDPAEDAILCDSSGDCDSTTAYSVCVLNKFPTCVNPTTATCPLSGDFFPAFPPTVLDPRSPDTDGDSLPDGVELELGADPLDPFDAEDFIDSDKDGLPDSMEDTPYNISVTYCSNTAAGAFDGFCEDGGSGSSGNAYALGTDCSDCGPRTVAINGIVTEIQLPDTDFDGLPDLVERAIGTDATEPDTDKDGLLDYDEFNNFGEYLALNFQYEGFMLSDAGSQKYGTNPNSQDTDGDRLADNFELTTSWIVIPPGASMSRTVFASPLSADTDGDQADDRREYRGRDGWRAGGPGDTGDATDPTDPDTDDDGRQDGAEYSGSSNPLVPDISMTVRHTRIQVTDSPGGETEDWAWGAWVEKNGVFQGTLSSVDTCRTAGCAFSFNSCNEMQANQFTMGPGGAVPISFGMVAGDVLTLQGFMFEIDGCGCWSTQGAVGGTTTCVDCNLRYTMSYSFNDLTAGDGFRTEDLSNTEGGCTAVFRYTLTRN
jgi:hypothetical protein